MRRGPDLGGSDGPLRPKLGRAKRERSPKLFIANVLAAKELAGFGLGRASRSSYRKAPAIGRGGAAAWHAGRSLLAERSRRVIVKARIVRHGPRMTPLRAHLSYLRREGVTRDGAPARMFDAASDEADPNAFARRCDGDRHHFRFVVSPEDAAELTDLKAYTRDLAAEMERDLGTRLDWVALGHWNTDNPHVHLLVRGKGEDGRDLVIHREYISRGMRARAQELATIELGPKAEREIRSKLAGEVDVERWTRLDRTLQRIAAQSESGVIDFRPDPESGIGQDSQLRGMLIGRLQRLEAMGLAHSSGPARWTLADQAEPVLRAAAERGDIIKTMNRALGRHTEDAAIYGVSGPEKPLIGRVAAKGLDDELAGKPYLAIEGTDGRAHYIRLGAGVDLTDVPEGGVIRVARSTDGNRTTLRVLSDLSVEHQVMAHGATLLDRELVGREKSELAASGFGAEMHDALDRRTEHLISEQLATRRGRQVVFATDLLVTLEKRELSAVADRIAAESGLAYHPAQDGERVTGVYQRRLSLASGRFALVTNEASREFSLVPWRPEVERGLGKEVSAVMRGRTPEWSLGRHRYLSV